MSKRKTTPNLQRGLDDPDARLLRWGWLAFAAWAPIGGAQLWQAMRAGDDALVGLALAVPAWAAWLLWLSWHVTSALRRTAVRRAYGRWHGSYHEFDGRQIRVVLDGSAIFVAAADVFDALGIERPRRQHERVRLLAGREGLVELHGGRLQAFTEAGLRAWMEKRTDATAVRFRRWFEKEVVGPRRRRDAGAAAESADARFRSPRHESPPRQRLSAPPDRSCS